MENGSYMAIPTESSMGGHAAAKLWGYRGGSLHHRSGLATLLSVGAIP